MAGVEKLWYEYDIWYLFFHRMFACSSLFHGGRIPFSPVHRSSLAEFSSRSADKPGNGTPVVHAIRIAEPPTTRLALKPNQKEHVQSLEP